ncbi:hypothetical protein BN7_2561 [Wickerhamomyces ciferrii]|uniref:Nitrogen regulatory protein areA GATA-like domain-containing protein n=1 Tax=Wickerhamomyces ciferrii (strain ATCC 14091 / BCRC 22168 / CBS 111 / JCM 3599 / NBRC 0793 / NRRL Y-1031 F-60-10) TaxID=1206466 RepID=K0KNN9_WICCF|nr:uncharacterized protein BN7_2561 [Wickerhamomyces ciferrii]CCH43014.1 hypothetical protein BN7_2561 [Wickerhamomyces ciferrii]
MVYSYDDQYNIVTKKSSGHLSSSNDHLITDFAIDYFQYQFDEIELHNCWKIIRQTNHVNSVNNIPLSTDIDRLENILWRKWSKIKSNLPELAPEEVNWYKDCDITWLYGPLAGSSYKLNENFQSLNRQALYEHNKVNNENKLTPARTDSFSSMTSASTADTVDEEDEVFGVANDEILLDENYMDKIGGSNVRPILKKSRRSSCLGYLEFDAPPTLLSKGNLRDCTNVDGSDKKHGRKSVSFDTMVQIRQFETEEDVFYD